MLNRLLFLVEGGTEEEFANSLLAPHFLETGYIKADARLIGLQRNRLNRGGIVKWPSALRDIRRHVRQDAGLVVTTFVDYYGLPSDGANAWPGRGQSTLHSGQEKAKVVERAVFESINCSLEGNLNPKRFIPFVMMHEF